MRYVILRHTVSQNEPGRELSHFDFMLETESLLTTWQLPDPGAREFSDFIQMSNVIQLPDHRPIYLEYEGEVSRGRGRVVRREQGEYEIIRRDSDRMEIALRGAKLSGLAVLERDSEGNWSFQFSGTGLSLVFG